MIHLFHSFLFAIIVTTGFVSASEKWLVEPLGKYEINSSVLGGLSALHVKNFGKELFVLTDKAKYFELSISRDSENKIIDLQILTSGSLLSSSGKELSGRNIDSESIAVADKKGFYISFESNNRVMFHETLNSKAKFLPKHRDFENFDFNKGLESIATNSDGELYAIPEIPPNGSNNYPIYKLKTNNWEIIETFETNEDFLVSDAYFLPNDDLLLLERSYNWSIGFKTQLRVLQMIGNNIKGQYIIIQLDSGKHNHEGLSIWNNQNGDYFVSIISDNNFIPFITSEILEFKLFKAK